MTNEIHGDKSFFKVKLAIHSDVPPGRFTTAATGFLPTVGDIIRLGHLERLLHGPKNTQFFAELGGA